MSKMLKVGQVAKELSTDVQQIRRWTKQGRIPVFRHPISNIRFYNSDDIELLREAVEQWKGAT